MLPRGPDWFRTDIQGLRAVAVLLVVAFHAGVGPRAGFVGVDVFFVISGAVVGAHLLRELDGTGSIRVGQFWVRRARRLMPAMALFTVATAIATALLINPHGPQQRILGTGVAATLWVANIHLYRTTGYFDGSAQLNPFLHTWSLSVEEQFYLLLPVGVLVGWWLTTRCSTHRRRSMLGVLVGLVALVSLGVTWWLSVADAAADGSGIFQAPQRLAFFSMPTRLWQFAAGVLVALIWGRRSSLPRAASTTAGLVGLGALILASVSLDPAAPHPGWWAIVVTGSTAVLLAVGGRRSPVDAVLSSPPMVWLGDRSYAWYLWHWPFIVFASLLWPARWWVAVVASAASLAVAAASFRFVERPLRSAPEWSRGRTAALVAACAGGPLAVLAAASLLAGTGIGVDEPSDWFDRVTAVGTRCHAINADAPVVLPDASCRQGTDDADLTVLLLGDELARGVEPAVVDAAAANGGAVVSWTRSGCPVLAGVAPVHSPGCQRWQDRIDEVVESVSPDMVVVAHQGPRYVAASGGPLDLADEAGRRILSADEAIERWGRGLVDRLDAFARAGVPVVVVRPAADFGDRFPRWRRSVLDPEPTPPVLGRTEVVAAFTPLLTTESEVFERYGAAAVDPLPLLCDDACRPVRGERWLYRGPAELTPFGASGIEPELRRLLAELER